MLFCIHLFLLFLSEGLRDSQRNFPIGRPVSPELMTLIEAIKSKLEMDAHEYKVLFYCRGCQNFFDNVNDAKTHLGRVEMEGLDVHVNMVWRSFNGGYFLHSLTPSTTTRN